ncbi:nucleotidyltransferase family protein [Candidatus Bipolaricaulota bacterium]
MRSQRASACQPTLDQEILLDAILLSGEEAINAWRDWSRHGDMDHIDPAEFQILPLLYRNLARQGVSDPSMGKLKGIYRIVWSRNHWLTSRALPTLRALHEEGVPIMLLKGAALNTLYGEQFGARLIADVDILVPKGDAQRAVEIVEDFGWIPTDDPPKVTADSISVTEGVDLVHPGGGALDLHWHLFPENQAAAHEDPAWRYAIAAPIAGVPTLAPSPTEMLLHVCVHGWAWSPHPPFRWVADSMTILRASSTKIDWERLTEDARRRRLVPQLEAALTYLQARFGAGVPIRVLTNLRATPTSRLDRSEYRTKTRRRRTPAGGLTLRVLWFHRLRDEAGLGFGIMGFLDYLRRAWRLERVAQVPLRMGIKLTRRFTRYLRRETK